MKTNTTSRKGFVLPIIIVAVLLLSSMFIYRKYFKMPSPAINTATADTPKPKTGFFPNLFGQKPTPSQPVSMILDVRTTKTLDPKSGAGGVAATTFSAKEPVIYVALHVNKPIKGTKFEYVRYFNGKYIDHKSLTTTIDKVDYVSFSWKLAAVNSKHLDGNYTVKLYVNGNFEKELNYQVSTI